MSALQAEVFEAFRAIDVPEGRALRPAAAPTSALDKVQDDVFGDSDKRDADVEAIRADLSSVRVDFSGLRVETAAKADLGGVRWDVRVLEVDMAVTKRMLDFFLATDVAILFELLVHSTVPAPIRGVA